MSETKTVCIYCGSSGRVDERYKAATMELGKLLAGKGYDLVYGGGLTGLMGIAAEAFMQQGARVVGVIPGHLVRKEVAHEGLTELHVVETMHERKKIMVDRSDAFLILPGGLGTMDEFFEAFTWWQLGLHDKPIVIVNIDGFWDKLLDLLSHLAAEGFCSQAHLNHLIVVDKVGEVPEALRTAPREENDPRTKWI